MLRRDMRPLTYAFDIRHGSILADAEHALALLQWARAARAGQEGDVAASAAALLAAALHAELAAHWLGGELEASVCAAAAGARGVAGRLQNGLSCAPGDVSSALALLETALEQVNHRLKD